MIQYISFSNGKLEFHEDWKSGVWINIVPPHQKEDLEELAKKFEIPLDFLTDPLDIEERARYDREDDIKHIILNIPYKQTEEENSYYSTIPLGIVLIKDSVVTISPKENIIVTRFIEQRVKNFNPRNTAHFVLKIFEQTAIWYANTLKGSI